MFLYLHRTTLLCVMENNLVQWQEICQQLRLLHNSHKIRKNLLAQPLERSYTRGNAHNAWALFCQGDGLHFGCFVSFNIVIGCNECCWDQKMVFRSMHVNWWKGKKRVCCLFVNLRGSHRIPILSGSACSVSTQIFSIMSSESAEWHLSQT